MGIDSENDLLMRFPKTLSSRIERSVYNRRRQKLSSNLSICLNLASHFNDFENYFVVDSLPLDVCNLSRSSGSKVCEEYTYGFLDKDYCAAQSANYYGYQNTQFV